ncbi:ATP-dependent DNA helicase [Chondromyces crocatus]|uniref:Helicase n=1 Tax=Chondromyces crocatus TaxID=52 RepID=A0A0K1EL45_CHOCO|nr:ATP-dependent DNA helicase [Chondromyces crocatus]AKT41392.1 helicase [Chondromyces crocatus]
MMASGRSAGLLGPGGPLASALERYEEREGQLAMASAVERALAGDRVLLCEAGTGTGKTLAYLVPAILSGRKVVVSTATKALEDQIYTKDLPLIAQNLGLNPQAALVKGLGNYLCLRRYNELRNSPEAGRSEVRRALPLIEAWAKETETGDVAELVSLAEGDPIWREVSSSSDTRLGSSCEYNEACFVTSMRREAEEARLLIVNHHLFFADLAVKMAAAKRGFAGARALPAYDAVIFDEAHQLEEIATSFFGVRLSRARVEAMLRDADRAFLAAGLTDRVFGGGQGASLTQALRASSELLFGELAQTAVVADVRGEGRIPLPHDVWTGSLLAAYHRLDDGLEALANYAADVTADEAVRLVSQRATQMREDAAKIVDPVANQVTWAEARGRSAAGRDAALSRADIAVGASPVDLGWIFRDQVFERIGSVVLTSATLTTGGFGSSEVSAGSGGPASGGTTSGGTTSGRFKFLRARMGLDDRVTVPVEELEVPSPFDYARSSLLYTPRDLPEVSDGAFIARAVERTCALVAMSGGGAFVLCTSNRSLSAFAHALRERLPEPPLVQGEAPKGALLRRFRAARDAVLVATMSFWEGVDVPGEALRLVVIEKLPFAVPSDPVVAARCAALEAQGRAPFLEYSVPQAAITLKQGFGRLIRTRTDQGVVAILDRRVRTRGYGRVLLDSLPPAPRTERLEDVRAFWERLGVVGDARMRDAGGSRERDAEGSRERSAGWRGEAGPSTPSTARRTGRRGDEGVLDEAERQGVLPFAGAAPKVR